MNLPSLIESRTGTSLSPELKDIYIEIEEKHPNLVENILISEKWLYEDPEPMTGSGLKKSAINPERAGNLAKYFSGCVWFKDPVTEEIILGEDSSWIIYSINPLVWEPLSQSFPTLVPHVLAGPLTKTLGINVKNTMNGRKFISTLKSLNIDIDALCRIRKGDDTLFIFSCDPEKSYLSDARENRIVSINNEKFEDVTILGLGSLIPIPETVKFNAPGSNGFAHDYYTIISNPAGIKNEKTILPEFFHRFFYAKTEDSEIRKNIRQYRKQPQSYKTCLQLIQTTIRALTVVPSGKLREQACEKTFTLVCSELKNLLGEQGVKTVLASIGKKSGIKEQKVHEKITSLGFEPALTILLLFLLKLP